MMTVMVIVPVMMMTMMSRMVRMTMMVILTFLPACGFSSVVVQPACTKSFCLLCFLPWVVFLLFLL